MLVAILALLCVLGIGIGLLGTSIWWLGLLVIFGAVWNVYVQVASRRQIDFETAVPVEEAAAVVVRVFGGRTWELQGNGNEFRARNRWKLHSPTVAVNLQPNDQGTTTVSIWVSNARFRYGIMYHAQFVWRKIRSVIGALRRETSTVIGTTPRKTERSHRVRMSNSAGASLGASGQSQAARMYETLASGRDQQQSLGGEDEGTQRGEKLDDVVGPSVWQGDTESW
jgi:hypothetical protein